jgi:hypothetical protein
MTTVKQHIENLKEYDENEHILVLYWSKELGYQFVESSLETIKTENNLSDEQITKLFDESWEYATDSEYETPDVGDSLIDNLLQGVKEGIKDLLNNSTDDKELWEA